jgi:uncharacterized protein YraI
VRAEPNTVSAALGMAAPFAKVQITGKDPSGSWYQILFAGAPQGKGWIAAQYVQVQAEAQIPVIGAAAGSGSAVSGLVIQQLNVRSGPGTDYNSLGILNPNDVVTLIGKNDGGAWLQIAFSGAPEGKGWVTASFVRANGVENLPIVTEAGRVIGSSTPTNIPATPTPTLIPARDDGDSAQLPAVNVTFSAHGARALIYSSDVSSPKGDAEDWVRFTPYRNEVLIQLDCTGIGTIYAQVFENERVIKDNITCGSASLFDLKPGEAYLVRLSAVQQEKLQSWRYILKVENAK